MLYSREYIYMAHPNKDREYLGKLQNYFATYRNFPSYASIGQLLGIASKSAVSALVNRLKLQGYLDTTPDKRLSPTNRFFERELSEFPVPAGMPAAANDTLSNMLSIDEYLIHHPSSTMLITVKGDSMIEKGIHNGDIAIIEKRYSANTGDIVVAIVDGEYTIKTLAREKGAYVLLPANNAYPIIRPQEHLEIFGVLVGLIRKYR
jgi:repressor LexA